MLFSPGSVSIVSGRFFATQNRMSPPVGGCVACDHVDYRFFLARLGAAFLDVFFLAERVLVAFFLKAWSHPSEYLSVEPTRTIDIFFLPLLLTSDTAGDPNG